MLSAPSLVDGVDLFQPFQTNGISMRLHDGPLFILRGQRFLFPKHIAFSSLKMDLVLANSAVSNEMPHNAVFYLGLRSFPKYMFKGFLSAKCEARLGSPNFILNYVNFV